MPAIPEPHDTVSTCTEVRLRVTFKADGGWEIMRGQRGGDGMKVLRSGPSYVGGDDSQDTMCNLGDSGRKGYGQEASTAPGGKDLGKDWECGTGLGMR